MDDTIKKFVFGSSIVLQKKYFAGKWYVDIRKHYTNSEFQLAPTKKGIMIPIDVWYSMMDKIDDINKMIGEEEKVEDKVAE